MSQGEGNMDRTTKLVAMAEEAKEALTCPTLLPSCVAAILGKGFALLDYYREGIWN